MLRQKKYICNDFLEIEIFPKGKREKTICRAKRIRETSPAQKKHNSKRRERYFVRLINLNFENGDLALDLTFKNKPESYEEALRLVRNYIARLKRYRKKHNLSMLKYVYAISETDIERETVKRIHVHMIINSMDRDAAEKLWRSGFANSDRLKSDEYGFAGKAIYMVRQGRSKRSWSGSLNLKKVEAVVSDKAVSKREFERMANAPDDRRFFEKKYKGWIFTDCSVIYDEHFGNTFCLVRMRRYSDERSRRWQEKAKD